MTFAEYWQEMTGRGFEDTATNRTLAESAWDAALCAASAGAHDRGKIKDGQAIMAAISKLHTWNKPTEPLS